MIYAILQYCNGIKLFIPRIILINNRTTHTDQEQPYFYVIVVTFPLQVTNLTPRSITHWVNRLEV